MCGIAGIISRNTELVSTNVLKDMAKALAHRGADGEAVWINPGNTVGLSHRRLAIIDLSEAAAQPMHYLGRYTIIYNGEIYNYIELKNELKAKGHVFRTASDTEVILASYQEYKTGCVTKFDGMFSFVIWDEEEKELFAARDRFGEKPFFYFFDENRLVFGSEMKALWAAGVDKKPNLKMLFNFLTIGYVDNPNQPEETFFENIIKLPPAHTLCHKLNSDELVIERYWDLDPGITQEKITDLDAIEKFQELFNRSIKRRLRSDVPIGTCLSGGLDSSSVAAVSKSRNENSFSHSAFTSVFPGFEKDESLHAKLVADTFGLRQFLVSPTAEELLQDMEKLAYHQEEPFGSASVFMQFRVYELAAQNNIKVLLDGQGADETLAGYPRYFKWYWQELFRKRKLLSSHELSAARKNGVSESFGFKNIIASLVPDFAAVFLEKRYLLNALRQEDLSKDFVRLQSKEAYYTSPPIMTLNGSLYFNTIMHGLEELLRYADRNSMAHGREPRLPFLDHELVEFIFSLPSQFKIRDGRTKWILRKAMEKHLPAQITWRQDKVGFEPPQKEWMQNKGVQDMIMESKRKLVNLQVLKPGVLEKKIRPHAAHEAESFDWRYWSAAAML